MHKLGRTAAATFIALTLGVLLAYGADRRSPGATQLELDQARTLIKAEDYNGAMAILDKALAENPKDANALNLAGYSAMKSGNLGDAATYYASALEANPNHRGALEYQGELYLMLGRPEKAKYNLNLLRDICGEFCEEYRDLAQALAEDQARN